VQVVQDFIGEYTIQLGSNKGEILKIDMDNHIEFSINDEITGDTAQLDCFDDKKISKYQEDPL
jgi:hypothetical protein